MLHCTSVGSSANSAESHVCSRYSRRARSNESSVGHSSFGGMTFSPAGEDLTRAWVTNATHPGPCQGLRARPANLFGNLKYPPVFLTSQGLPTLRHARQRKNGPVSSN